MSGLRAIEGRIAEEERLLPGRRSFLLKPRGRAKGRVLLFHGFSASPWEVRQYGEHLQKKGWLVYGPRLAGHGLERADFDRNGSAEWKAEAEHAFLQFAEPRKKLALIGHSAGGVLATMLATKYPAAVSHLVLGAPAFKLADPWSSLTLFPPVRFLKPSLHFKNDDPESIYWTTSYATHRIPELIRLGREGRLEAAQLKIPVLLLQSENDDQTSRPFNEALFDRIPSKKKQLFIYDTDEHNVFYKSNPMQAVIFKAVDQFIGA